jgi:hypothetical protein
MIIGVDMSDTVDRRLEDHFITHSRIAADRRTTKSRAGRSLAWTRNAKELLCQAFPARRFEVGSVSFDKTTYVAVTWSGAPSRADIKRVLAPLSACGVRLQLNHEEELARRRRLALRAASRMLSNLELEDTPETLGERLTEKLCDFIPSTVVAAPKGSDLDDPG